MSDDGAIIAGPESAESIVICTHCGKVIYRTRLMGLSVICPSCARCF